jgi:D-arabinose 1-dehydrogenase-like Zn-dependent alcohol dehydrogenase
MPSMTAARFHAASATFGIEEVDIPTPGRTEVLVKVEACGICSSDVHLIGGMLPPPLPSVTPGHEAAGTIAAVGEDVPASWQEGSRVVLSAGRKCGQCPSCTRGGGIDECTFLQVMGAFYDGAWAQYVVVGFEQLVAIPDHLSFEQAAILADAVTTPYSALLDTAQLRPAESIGIWGIGGLGTHAVQIARLTGAAPIIAVDRVAEVRQRALDLGADAALDPAATDFADQLRALTGGRGLDVAAEFVGFNDVRAQAVQSLGLSPDPIVVNEALPFLLQAQSMGGHLGGGVRHLQELVNLVALGRLDLSGSVSEAIPLTEVANGIHTLEKRETYPVRIVVKPWS